jgi:hypothetical protein
MGVQLLCSVLLAFTLSASHMAWPVIAILVLFGSARAFMMAALQAVALNRKSRAFPPSMRTRFPQIIRPA